MIRFGVGTKKLQSKVKKKYKGICRELGLSEFSAESSVLEDNFLIRITKTRIPAVGVLNYLNSRLKPHLPYRQKMKKIKNKNRLDRDKYTAVLVSRSK